ncbi:MAG: hypothetical protein U0894_03875 [Pirellulales bacterium]
MACRVEMRLIAGAMARKQIIADAANYGAKQSGDERASDWLPAGDASDAELPLAGLRSAAIFSQATDEMGTKSGNSPEEIQLEIGEAILDRGISLNSAGLSGMDPQSSSISQIIMAATLLAWRWRSTADGDLVTASATLQATKRTTIWG